MDNLTLQGKLDYGKAKSLFKKHIRRYYKNKEVVTKSEFQERQLPRMDEENTPAEQSHSHAERTHSIKRQHSNTPQAYTCHRGQNHIWKNVFWSGIQPQWYQTAANKWLTTSSNTWLLAHTKGRWESTHAWKGRKAATDPSMANASEPCSVKIHISDGKTAPWPDVVHSQYWVLQF